MAKKDKEKKKERETAKKEVRQSAAKAAAAGLSEHILSGNALREKKKISAAAPDPTFGTGTVRVKASKDGTKAELDMPKKAVSSWVKSDAAKRMSSSAETFEKERQRQRVQTDQNKRLRQRLSSAAASAAKEDADSLLKTSFKDRMKGTQVRRVPDPTFGTNMLSDKISGKGIKNYVRGTEEREQRRKIANAWENEKKNLEVIKSGKLPDTEIKIPGVKTMLPRYMGERVGKEAFDIIDKYATDDERRALRKVLETKGQNEYGKALRAALPEIGARGAREESRINYDYGRKHPFLASAASVPANMEAGVQASLDSVEQQMKKQVSMIGKTLGTEKMKDYFAAKEADENATADALMEGSLSTDRRGADVYTQAFQRLRNVQAMREGAGSHFGDFKIVYDVGMSVLDSVLATAVAGPGATGILAANAAASGMISAAERGASDDQIIATGVAQGVAEGLFEKLSIDHFIKTKNAPGLFNAAKLALSGNKRGAAKIAKTAGLNILKQSAIEGSEEAFTEVANILTDAAIMDGSSETQLRIREYVQGGMSEKEARKKAYIDNVGQVALSAAGGALSGALMGSFGAAIGNGDAAPYTNESLAGQESFYRSAGERGASFENASAADSMQALSPAERESAYRSGQQAFAQSVTDTIKKDPGEGGVRLALLRSGFTGTDDAVLARDIIDFARGKKLTDGQRRRMSTNDSVMRVTEAIAASPETMEAIRNRYAEAQSRAETVRGENKKDSSNTGSAQESALPNRPELSFNNSVAQNSGAVKGENLTNEGGSQRLDPRTPIEEIRRTMGEDAAMTELFRRESGLFQTAGRNGDDFETLFSQAPLRMIDRQAAETAYRAGIKDRFYAAGENGESFESVRGFAPERMQAAAAEAYQKGLDSRARNAEQIYSGETREGGGYGRPDTSGKQPGLVWNEEAQQLTPQERKNIAALARKLGKRVYIQTGLVTDDGRAALGKINDAAIYADPSRGTLVQDIIVHEFSHRMKQLSPDSWQKYADYAINDLKKTGRYDGIYSEFTKHYDGMAESEIHEEMAADYAYKMFDSEESLTELIRQDKPLAEKIKDVWFALLEKLGRDVTLKRAKNMWKMCLTEAGKTAERGGNQSGTKYMFVGKINGYDAYRSDFPESMPQEKRLEKFKERIASIFNLGRVSLNTDTKKITVAGDKFTMQKNVYGDKKASDKEADVKIDALYDIADILRKSRFVKKEMEESYKDPSKKPKNAAHKNVKYWYKFKNTIVFDGDVYDVTFNIRDKGKEQFQYLIDFKQKGKAAKVSHTVKKTSGERYLELLSDNSVTQPGGVVKGENSSNQGKNMLPFEGGQREFTRTEERHAGQRAYKPTDTMTAREWQTERRNGNTVDAASLREIADIVRNDFGIPVSKEHFENENVTGIFNEMPETIRTAVTNDIVTVAHEVGHLLDRKLGLEDSPHLQQAFDMIDRDFAMNYSGKEIKDEAVSEFIRTYIKNKDEAKAAAPDFYEDFESRIRGTEYEKPLARLADSVNAYLSAGATERINLALAPEESKKTVLKRAAENKAKMGEVFARFQNDWVDSFYGIKRAETLLQVKEKGKYRPYVLATNSRNAASKAAYILTQKFVDHEGNEIGDSFIDCLNPLNSKNRKQRESNLSELNRYLILKHALEWIEPQNGAKQKRVFADPTLENPDVIRSEIARIEQNVPQVREAAERIYEYQRNLMQIYGVESGGISQQTADDLRKKYPCYVPFIRQSEKKKTMRARSTIANQKAPVMHAFGGGELIVNPLESIIGKTESYVKFAARNSAMRALTDIADSVPGSGFVIEKLGGDMLRHVQTTDNADARLSEAKNRLNTAEGIPQEFNGIEDVGSWESLIKRGTEYVSVMKDGKKQYYQVHDKELLRSIADMSPNQLNGFLKFSRMILNARKVFITQMNYLFSTTNPARDIQTAWHNMGINNPAQFVGEYFSALMSVAKKDESYRRWCAMGGGQSSELSANIDEISRSMSKAMNGRLRYAIENPTEIFSEIFGAVADLNDLMESAPRLMAFKNEMKRSGDVQQAIYEADDVTTNFKRMGTKGRVANSMFMFANAQIQGLDRGIRSFTDASAGERTARIAKYVIGAMLMAALKQWWNREKDEDGYNKLSNYMKNAHTIIALGKGSFLRIPNAREQSLASAALDRAMDYFKGDKEAFDGFIGFAVDNLMPPFIPVPTDTNGKSATDIFTDCILEAARNTMFGTATDFMANKNFTGSPIVPEAYSDLPPEQQYNERTTKPAIWLGKKLKDSPMRLDYIINNNLGVFGNINKALLPNDDAQRDKTLGFKNRWTADAYYSTDILNREYEAKDAADMELKRSNTPKNAEDYYGKLEKTTYISQMNGAINEMPQDEKRGARKRLLDVVTGWSAADTEVSDELRRLYKKTGENRFWQTPDRTFNVNGEEVSLSPKKYEKFALEARENFDKNAAELIKSKLYKSLNDAEKAEAMQSVREYTVAAGRKDADRNYSLEKWQAGVYSGDVSLNDSISEKVTKKRTEAAKERKRAEISIDTKNATGYTKEQAERLTSEAAQYYANKEQDKNYVGTNTYAHMEKYENTLKKYMPLNDYLQIRTGYYAYKESIGKRDKSSLKKQELTAYINSCTDSREVRRALFDALPHGGSKNPY